ncbi:MAG: S10 family serine carboxypeptidase-like protein, partial [Planctomycetaceae bacterium]
MLSGHMHMRLVLFSVFLWITTAIHAVCQDSKPASEPPEKLVETQHEAAIAGQTVPYTVNTGRLLLRSDDGNPKASIFFVSYSRRSQAAAARPITFCFNGGPGSSSVWLHLGMLGPQRVRFPENAAYLKPPYRLEANPWSLLDVTDLVFIDP